MRNKFVASLFGTPSPGWIGRSYPSFSAFSILDHHQEAARYGGIYELSFTTAQKDLDYGIGGIVPFKDGAINGGDAGYTYAGKLSVDADGLATGRLRVSKWSTKVPSVLTGLDNYELDFVGQFHGGDSLDGSADVVGNNSLYLTIMAHKVAEAA